MAKTNWLIAFISLGTAVTVLSMGRGLMKLVPVICGIAVGYLLYGIGVLCVGTVILMLFIAAGWSDMETLNQNLQVLMSARK